MLKTNRKMKQFMGLGKNALVMLMCLSLVFSTFTPLAMAGDEVQAETDMRHSPPDYFVPDHRIQMDARVSDPSGVELVRCYFKAQGEADFVFVPMTNTRRNNYSGILPAPSAQTEQIEYLFLAVNAENEVVKSQTFTIYQEDKDEPPAWQDIPTDTEIQVSMELDQVPDDLAGFSDNIAMNAVESGARFGVVAGGLYHMTSSTSGSAAAATTAGTVSAGAAGIGTAGAVALGVGAAAAVGGAAAAGGGSSGGGSSSNGGGEQLSEKTILGNWKVQATHPDGRTARGDFRFDEDGTFSYTNRHVTRADGSSYTPDNTGGNWTLSGNYLSYTFVPGGAVYQGTASGDSRAFRMVADNNDWTQNFTR